MNRLLVHAWIGFLLVILLSWLNPLEARVYRWVTFDVGHGDAHVLETPDRKFAVIDTASTSTVNPLLDFLHCRGADRIHTLVLSHPHWDHIGGATELIQQFSVEKIWKPGVSHPTQLHRQLLEQIKNKNIPVHTKRRGDTGMLLPTARAEILNPAPPLTGNLNQDSLAFLIDVQPSGIAFMADVTAPLETKIYPKSGWSRVGLLKVAHHGDRKGTTGRLLDRMKPMTAVISAPLPQEDPWGYPHEEVFNRLKNEGTRIYWTGEEGTISIEFLDSREASRRDQFTREETTETCLP